MQTRKPTPPPSGGLLEQKWVTYLLLALVIILTVALYFTAQYQEEILRFFRNLLESFQKERMPPKPKPTLHWSKTLFHLLGR